jgi:galactose mutarotase-like enzyme
MADSPSDSEPPESDAMPNTTTISNDQLTVAVSSLGAEMQSLASTDGRNWLWNGRSPILFPIVGKAPDNHVSINGQSYEMNQHGFARRSEFTLAASSQTLCCYELAADETTRAVYPFDFRLALTHSLEGRVLTLTAEVTNSGAEPMPFGLGYHPAFVWPLPGAEGEPHTVTLDNGAEPALSRIDNGLRKPELLASPFHNGQLTLDHAMFVEDAMIFPDGAGAGLTYGAEGGPALKFQFDNLPNLALWTKPGAPFLCIEPWHGTAPITGQGDDIAKRPNSLTLAPGASARFAFSVEIPA